MRLYNIVAFTNVKIVTVLCEDNQTKTTIITKIKNKIIFAITYDRLINTFITDCKIR